ncbi:MAG: tRNA lysidine(34) synthetase TilS [Flavobacteriaceae bacterium]|nr:tRNA lysidine(34) synthetase TilS [Flavobacteriaceae bacterium]
MLEIFREHIENTFPFLKKARILVGVSAGVDSKVLSELCMQAGLDISLAHCNFNLRADESDEDEKFVLQWAEENELEIFVQHFRTKSFARENNLSMQMAARELRYSWFNELADQLGYEYILTAHHADDNLETFFINLFRGSGIEGLKGIPSHKDRVMRPLLIFSRETILDYAEERQLKWREDSSNASTKYLRNKIRKELTPVLKTIEPDILMQLAKSRSHLEESSLLLSDYKKLVNQEVSKTEGDTISIDIEKLSAYQPLKAYLYLLLSDYGFTQWDDIVDLVDAQSGKQVFSLHYRLLKDRQYLVLKPNEERDFQPMELHENMNQIATPLGYVEINEVRTMGDTNERTVYIDKEKLKFPLILRKWEEGDYFYPFGVKGRKKISKYFKDEKFSLFNKESALILCSGKDVVWIVGYRSDDRYKVTPESSDILKVQLN